MRAFSKSIWVNFLGVYLYVIFLLAVFRVGFDLMHETEVMTARSAILLSTAVTLSFVTGLLIRLAILRPFLLDVGGMSREKYSSGIERMKKNSWRGYIPIVLGMLAYSSCYIIELAAEGPPQPEASVIFVAFLGFICVLVGSLVQLRYFFRGVVETEGVSQQ